ncbi:ATP-binding cassette domain-containing protein [Lipingzhangella sp. LS1_29]|uniref:ATP-binding cassette domain-containing protein n=1 Tax=Lipingzhangella rawalii TaxID=2055835 RepID=A0ABU2HAZ0_9ACTN|nr:ATP-binding cassette domain-containing protein [Lipingzhangella rawalii]MDS1272034.1 ATP-binding cassette domain-containing protein [Lipingzhangella rawalii]
MITFTGVSKRYPGGTVAVDQLDLEVPAARTTVLVGPSGCGKTTTLRMINRMVEHTEGHIAIDGQDIRARDPVALRRSIGYVIQQAGLFPHRTVQHNIATVPFLVGTTRRAALRRSAELMELVGLAPELAQRYPQQLSGGQQQRVGVARALAADPPILLMDEPFSAVDPVVRKSLQEELLRLQRELRKTIVFVTHDIDEAVRIGDAIAVFRPGGRLAQFDHPEHLLAEPVDEFVEAFLGYDRGVRRLSFFPASELQLRRAAIVDADHPAGAALGQARSKDEPWLLAVDSREHPLGWIHADTLANTAATTPVGELDLVRYGHVFTVSTDSLRAALDAAMLSPASRAVGVDRTGRVLGVVRQTDLSAAIWDAGGNGAAGTRAHG